MNRYAAAASRHPLATHAVGEVAGEILDALGGTTPDLLVWFMTPHHVGTLDEIQSTYGHDTVRVKATGGRAALTGFSEIESMNDYGNYQDLRLTGDAQAFLQKLAARAAVQHFEITKPSLHDIFVRIAQPTADDLKRPVSGAD